VTTASLALARTNPTPLLAFLDGCKISDDSLNCRLDGALTLLHVLGAVLAVILLAVIAFAARAWYEGKNSGEFPPERPRSGRRS
jgi:hypothetical protein